MSRNSFYKIKNEYYQIKAYEKYEITVSVFLMIAYIFFIYTAQKTLIPPIIHSCVMYIFIGWTALNSLNKGLIVFKNYTKWYLIMIAFSTLSYIWAREMVTETLYNMFVALVITECFIITINTYERLELCIKTFVLSADVMCFLLCITGQVSLTAGERLGESVTGNANSFSALLMIAAVFASWLFIYKKDRKNKIFNLISMIFLLFLMGISGGRKTIITVIVCFIWFIFIKDIKSNIKIFKNILKIIIILCLLYLAIMKIPVLYNTVGERFKGLFTLIGGGTSSVSSDAIRVKLVEIGLQGWLNKPILGYGFDNFKYFNRDITGHFYYAHNNYVEMLFDLGLIGFIFYYSFILNLIYKLWKNKYLNRKLMALGIGIILELLFFDLGGISYYTVLTQILLCLSFIVLTIERKLRHGK